MEAVYTHEYEYEYEYECELLARALQRRVSVNNIFKVSVWHRAPRSPIDVFYKHHTYTYYMEGLPWEPPFRRPRDINCLSS